MAQYWEDHFVWTTIAPRLRTEEEPIFLMSSPVTIDNETESKRLAQYWETHFVWTTTATRLRIEDETIFLMSSPTFYMRKYNKYSATSSKNASIRVFKYWEDHFVWPTIAPRLRTEDDKIFLMSSSILYMRECNKHNGT